MFENLRKYDIICHMKDLMFYYKKSMRKNFALGAFNFSSLEVLKAIASAAEKTGSPAIIAVSESALEYMGENFVMANAKLVKESCKAPLFLHLDHGKSFEICKKAVDLGFDSVMIDASALPFEENVALTKKVCDYAHEKGVFVEGELGQIAGIEDNTFAKNHLFTDPQKAKEFVKLTKVDSLAVAIGTSHGAYKFSRKPTGDILSIERVKEIHRRLPNTHLVMHGSSSVPQEYLAEIREFGGDMRETYGVPVEEIQEAIKHGVRKVNIDTDIRLAMTAAVRRYLVENPSKFDPREYLKAARKAAYELCKKRYLEFGCEGQGARIKPVDLFTMAKRYGNGELKQNVL